MSLSVVLRPSENDWHAIGMEHFIVARGSSDSDVIHGFCELLAAEVAYGMRHGKHDNPLVDIPQAPDDLWEIFEGATPYQDASSNRMTVILLENDQEVELPKIIPLRRAA